jgi:hypothetical protein
MKVYIQTRSIPASFAAFLLTSHRVAVVFGNTVHLHNTTKEEFLADKKWVCHELTHVMQYRQHGFFLFIVRYLIESIKHGYRNNKFEIEARQNETNFQLLERFQLI